MITFALMVAVATSLGMVAYGAPSLIALFKGTA